MAPDSSEGRADATDDGDDAREDPRVMLFMGPGRNRELLVETLGGRYRVATTTDVEQLEADFDCCIFDLEQFNRVAGTLQPRRDTSNPVFLPFVLLVGEDAPDGAAVEARDYVDDVVELPVKKRALLSRVGNLVERRRTATRLAERGAELRRTVDDLKLKERAMDAAPVGISITDPDRNDNPIIYVNDRFGELTGYTDMVGENCRFLQGEETNPETVATIREAVDAGRPVSVDILNYRKNDRKFWNKLDVAPIRDEEGALTHFVGFQKDITERKIQERRLEVLNRVLSHNLRNKMNVIEGHLALLRDEFGDDEPPSLTAIEETAGDLLSLADSIREIERTLSSPEPAQPVVLAEHIGQLVSTFEDRFDDVSLELTVLEDDPCPVAVPGLVAAIEEVIENAIKHNHNPDPAVEIRLYQPSDDWVTIEIEDNGPGIPEQELAVLDEGETPLNHADRVGLWFVYWVVSQVGGKFSVTDSDSRGSELRLSVPVRDADRS